LIAPVYDVIVARATSAMRRESLLDIGEVMDKNILLAGYGTGLDNPHLPAGANYLGLDLTPAMLIRARQNMSTHVTLQCGDAMRMPYADNSFDVVVLHLILAVVPQPVTVLKETARVLKSGGRVLLLDKFIRPGQLAPIRRLVNIFIRHIATRTDVVFEQVLAEVPTLRCTRDVPCAPGGWFRRIMLTKEQMEQS
jgi:phosphatidylethanolamine/phosphatidyl-N-methylethanolamine N-methyltransferase